MVMVLGTTEGLSNDLVWTRWSGVAYVLRVVVIRPCDHIDERVEWREILLGDGSVDRLLDQVIARYVGRVN